MSQFWMLLGIYACASGSIYGSAIHLVPAVQSMGVRPGQAVLAATLFGVTAMLGRVVAGYLCDRFFAPRVAATVFLGGATGIAILAAAPGGAWSLLAALLIGFCSGAEGDTLAVLCSRYFGQRAYGKIYGHGFSATMVGISIVPYLVGVGFESLQGYRAPLAMVATVLATVALLTWRLGPYPAYDEEGKLLGEGARKRSVNVHADAA